MVKITVSSFKRLLGEALRAVKPEHMVMEIATKMAVYNKTKYVMRKAVERTEFRPVQSGFRMAAELPKLYQVTNYETLSILQKILSG